MVNERRYVLPTPYIPHATICELLTHTNAAFASTTWASANTAVLVPVVFPVSCTVLDVRARGTNTTGNYDLAFYDPALTRIASKGSTAMASADLVLTLGTPYRARAGVTYYAALVCSSTSSTVVQLNTADTFGRFAELASCGRQASALPLPDPFVPVEPNAVGVPALAFGLR